MVSLEVLQHEKEEVADDHGNDNAMSVDLKLVLGHFREFHLLVDVFFIVIVQLFLIFFIPFSSWYVIKEKVALREGLRFEATFLEELTLLREEVEASTPLSM